MTMRYGEWSSACWTRLAPMNPAPPVIRRVRIELTAATTEDAEDAEGQSRNQQDFSSVSSASSVVPLGIVIVISDRRALGILQRQAQFLRKRIDRRAGALPLSFGLEPQIADAAAPRRDDAADGTEVAPVGVLLVQTPDDIGRNANERAKSGRAPDAVLAPVPGAAEHQRNLLEVVDEELLGFLVHVSRPAPAEYALLGEQLLQFLRKRRLCDAATADAEQLDLIVERRVLTIVQCANDIVSGGQRIVAIQLASRQADEVRRVETRVLRIDRDKHLHDVVFRQAVENDGGDGKVLALEPIDVGMKRQQPVLAIDCTQNAFPLPHLQRPHLALIVGGVERQLFIARNDDRPRNRRQVARLPALLVVLHELVDLLPDDLPLVRLFTGGNPTFEKIPVDF